MLEKIRDIQNTWVGKGLVAIVMGLIMVSFVIWGIGPVFTGFNANALATIGGDTITVDAFRQSYQQQLMQLQQRARRPITNAEARTFGLDTQVLSHLVSDAVLDNQARGLGLAIGQDQVAKAITSDPAFAGADGKFDRVRFAEVLRDNDMNEQGFVQEQRRVYLRQELIQGLVGSLQAPQAAVEALHAFETETRSIDYMILPASTAGVIPAPDDTTLQTMFDNRATTFRTPAYRKLVILPLLPTTVADPAAVPDADVQALYDKVRDQRFVTPDTRTLQQIVFPTEDEARAAGEAIKGGKSFADVAADRKLTEKDIDIGTITKGGAYDKDVAAAAFALPDGGVSDPVKTPFGFALVRVAHATPAVVKPYAEVAPILRLEIAAGKSGSAITRLHDKIEDARASGQPLADAAKSAGLVVRVIDAVDANGVGKDGKPVELPDGAALLKAAFASDVGVDNDTIRTADGGQIFFEVAGVEPARPKIFAEVRPEVEALWRKEETARRLAAKAEDVVKSLNAGKTLEDASLSLGTLPIQHVADVRRSGGTGLSATVVAQLFKTPVDGVGTAPGDGDTRIVFKVLGSVVPVLDPDDTSTKQLSDQYQGALADGLINTYLTEAQGRLGVKINSAAYTAATGGG